MSSVIAVNSTIHSKVSGFSYSTASNLAPTYTTIKSNSSIKIATGSSSVLGGYSNNEVVALADISVGADSVLAYQISISYSGTCTPGNTVAYLSGGSYWTTTLYKMNNVYYSDSSCTTKAVGSYIFSTEYGTISTYNIPTLTSGYYGGNNWYLYPQGQARAMTVEKIKDGVATAKTVFMVEGWDLISLNTTNGAVTNANYRYGPSSTYGCRFSTVSSQTLTNYGSYCYIITYGGTAQIVGTSIYGNSMANSSYGTIAYQLSTCSTSITL